MTCCARRLLFKRKYSHNASIRTTQAFGIFEVFEAFERFEIFGCRHSNVDRSMMTDSARILVVDNYDSFVYTIVGYLKTLGATVTVVRNDAIDPSETV